MSGRAAAAAIDVAIVNWNTAEAALAAARSFLASTEVEPRLTIVDNHSRPPERQVLQEGCPEGVRLLLLDENLGYGRAANLALEKGRAELVCVCNADVLPEPDALAALASVALGVPKAGMVGPYFGGPTDHYHSRLPGPVTILGRIPVGSFAHRAVSAPPTGEVKRVDQPSGACFAMRRAVWRRIGGFDGGFFLWYEDVDLARRLRDAGFRNLVTGSARVGHTGASSFAQLDARSLQAIRLDSLERYIGKHHRRLRPAAAALLRLTRRVRAGRAGGSGRR